MTYEVSAKFFGLNFFLELHELIVLAACEGVKRLYHGRKGEACGGWTEAKLDLNFGAMIQWPSPRSCWGASKSAEAEVRAERGYRGNPGEHDPL